MRTGPNSDQKTLHVHCVAESEETRTELPATTMSSPGVFFPLDSELIYCYVMQGQQRSGTFKLWTLSCEAAKLSKTIESSK